MDRVKTENKQIARNAHCVESDSVTSVMSVESFIKEERNTMQKIKLVDAKSLIKNFGLTMEEISEKYEVTFPVVSGGKGMSVLEAIKQRDKKLIDLNFDVIEFISTDDKLNNFSELIEELTTGQKLNLLKSLVAGLNESDEFKRETKELYPNLVEGLQVEFNWKDKSKINKK
tara:strand:- start:15 stop:530 length:516 start_codon:yes stop_codon:yes gene_type:complete